MASVKYGAIITELKGKVGGQVFQGGNVGYVLRNKGYTPGISSTVRQVANSNLIANTKGWRNLTLVQQNDFNSRSVDWPFTDKYGNTYTGSGYQFFNALNTNLFNVAGTRATSVPVLTSATNYGTFTGSWSLAGNLRISWTSATIPADIITFFGSPSISAGRNGGNAPYKFIYNLASTGDTHYDLQLLYQTIASLPAVGSVVMIKVITRNSTWPYPSNIQTIRIVVTA